MSVLEQAITILLYLIPILFAITLHEVAHGWVAFHYGDPTAKLLGRITLNPLKHIDPVGTILVPGMLIYLGGIIFGWAKPVPVNWLNLRNPKRDMALVALAGPAANLVMCLIWALLWKTTQWMGDLSSFTYAIRLMSMVGVKINIVLMLLNLLPIPPLDGSRILASFLSMRAAIMLHRYEIFGFIGLVLLLTSGLLLVVLLPMYQFTFDAIKLIFHL